MRKRWAEMRYVLEVGRIVDRPLTRSLLLLTVTTNVTMALRGLWFKLLIDSITSSSVKHVTVWASCLAVSEGLRSWSLVGSQMRRMDLQDKAVEYFQLESLRMAANIPGVEHLERQDFLDRLAQLRAGFPTLGGAIASVVDLLNVVVRGVVSLALLITVQPLLVLLPFFAIPSLWAGRRAQQFVLRGHLEAAADNRRDEHYYGLLTQPTPATEVRLFGLQRELISREQAAWERTTRTQSRALGRSIGTALLGWGVFAIGYLLAILLVVERVGAGAASPGDVFLVVVLASQVNLQVVAAAELAGTLAHVETALESYRWLERYGATPEGAEPNASLPRMLVGGLRMTNMTFAYPGAADPVLRDLDIFLPAGKVVALVGENGAGKSTLVNLLCGLYPLQHGEMHIDGVNARDVPPEAWRGRIAAGFQDFVRFELSVQQTVGVGDISRIDDTAVVRDALDRAAASDVLENLPQGLETQLGITFGGIDLSGGEWQKLAVARAMARPTPLLLVLDEPTAALDPDAEYRLFGRYATAAKRLAASSGGVTLLVTHRFSTVRMADIIIVLESGRAVEIGSHDELISRGGLYADLFALQARSYR